MQVSAIDGNLAGDVSGCRTSSTPPIGGNPAPGERAAHAGLATHAMANAASPPAFRTSARAPRSVAVRANARATTFHPADSRGQRRDSRQRAQGQANRRLEVIERSSGGSAGARAPVRLRPGGSAWPVQCRAGSLECPIEVRQRDDRQFGGRCIREAFHQLGIEPAIEHGDLDSEGKGRVPVG